MRQKTHLTVEQVVAICKRKGAMECNPLQWRHDPAKNALFRAAKMGLLTKHRINAGRFVFEPVEGA